MDCDYDVRIIYGRERKSIRVLEVLRAYGALYYCIKDVYHPSIIIVLVCYS